MRRDFVPGERPAVAAALIDAIADELREPSAATDPAT
jgi:hypothetical protein